ncbi:autotransporter assembly complex protein TamA [Frigidibacter oleivorans]|uniref:autotransporter assembly complex protein TamA n=1 Tax=Frigidibacter oleivorans TaxID=2487129 RepID=UPI000F8C796D|nr:BamA/TamA family outer membrane protein [Frigidibacter oleivorans]
MRSLYRRVAPVLALGLTASVAGTTAAQDVTFRVKAQDDDALRNAILGASLIASTRRDEESELPDLYAAARADYGRLLGALYARGHYSGVISILIDGREAAEIPPLDMPERIGRIDVLIDPGPQFRFSRATAAPLVPGTELPEGYARGEPAFSEEIANAADAGAEGWRRAGHAKVDLARQEVTADHRQATLAADLVFAPGPRVIFGEMTVSGNRRVTTRRIEKIAGFPSGEVYDPEELEDVANRLRRTGTFRSVSLTEAETLGPGNTLDYMLVVSEERRRRLSFGAEISSVDGGRVTAGWLHRNLLGGAESLNLEAEVAGIGGGTGGVDYSLGARFERPGTPFRDSNAFIEANIARLQEEDYDSDTANLTFGLERYITDRLTGEVGLGYEASNVTDSLGEREFRQIILPVSLTWDARNSTTNATEGFYLEGGVLAFRGFADTGNGAQLTFDGRAYQGFADDRFVIAGRAQIGAVAGADLLETPRDYLFYSGGGGTVRGQPYQSLKLTVTDGTDSEDYGGNRFAAFSAELRAGITENIGVVAFYDAGYVGDGDFSDGEWHAGAGLGLRYNTGIGPIRLDVAAPAGGDTGEGVQVYIGLGQAF